jgi:hypothetical protein
MSMSIFYGLFNNTANSLHYIASSDMISKQRIGNDVEETTVFSGIPCMLKKKRPKTGVRGLFTQTLVTLLSSTA